MRCGFCNLFTRTGAPDGADRRLPRRAGAAGRRPCGEALGDGVAFAHGAAFGGGTPTLLTAGGTGAAASTSPSAVGRRPARRSRCRSRPRPRPRPPTGCACSPNAARPGSASACRASSTPRRAAVRARSSAPTSRRRSTGSATLGIRGAQHRPDLRPRRPDRAESWRHSLDAALAWQPEELYLYPLYVRPLTGLGRLAPARRRRLGRPAAGAVPARAATICSRPGYEQVSMRMFRRAGRRRTPAPAYCCQDDGMVGLGCGARSYTAGAALLLRVRRRRARAMRGDHRRLRRATDATSRGADYGFALDARRAAPPHLHPVASAAPRACDAADYRARFGTEAPATTSPRAGRSRRTRGWLDADVSEVLRLTPEGLAHSDAIGPGSSRRGAGSAWTPTSAR